MTPMQTIDTSVHPQEKIAIDDTRSYLVMLFVAGLLAGVAAYMLTSNILASLTVAGSVLMGLAAVCHFINAALRRMYVKLTQKN